MDLKSTKQLEALAALSDADRSRLERLAAMAQLSADDLWPDVWLYGFDDVEAGVLADIEAEIFPCAGFPAHAKPIFNPSFIE